jgi:hypothetical protein
MHWVGEVNRVWWCGIAGECFRCGLMVGVHVIISA